MDLINQAGTIIKEESVTSLFPQSTVPSFYLYRLIADSFLPYLVRQYYLNENTSTTTFLEFLSSKGTNLIKKAPFFHFISNHVQHAELELAQARKVLKSDEEVTILGDIHPEGMKCSIGNTVIHKDVLHIEYLVNRLSEELLGEEFPFFPVCKYQDGFWTRPWIETSVVKQDDAAEYYFHFGKICALVLFFKGMDFNFENCLVDQKGKPVLFDIEFLFNHQSWVDKYTISYTGLIGKDGGNGHISALLAGVSPIYSLLVPILSFENNNGRIPVIQWKVPSRRQREIPGGKSGLAKNTKTILEGCSEGLLSLEGKKKQFLDLILEEIEKHNIGVRILARPTKIYRYIQMSLNYLKAENPDSFIMNKLTRFNLINADNYNSTMIADEKEVLKTFSIPYFYSPLNSKNVIGSKGTTVGLFPETPFEHYKKHLEQFDSSRERYLTDIEALIQQANI